MIKLNSKGTASDYTEYGSVTTDCKTVGKFMTEAAAIYGGNLTIKVDGCRYILFDNPKIRVTDDTPIDDVTYACKPDSYTFIVKTKPKPKTVRKSGFVAVYNDRGRWMTNRFVFDSKEAATRNWNGIQEPIVAKIEWEEMQR